MAQEYNIVNGNQIFTALNSITRDSMAKKKKRKIDFRFLDKQDVTTPDEKKIAFDELKRIERELEALRIGLKLRTAREQQKLTQNELAQRINKKRTFISKVENDGENITLKTLYEIVELGLGGKLNISFEF